MGWQFYPVAHEKAAQGVVEQITFMIRSGAVQPGDRLPQIEELSEALRVSRPVVGEALKTLADAGIVETRRGLGGGAVVVSGHIPVRLINQSPYWQRFSLRALVEARRPIETAIALAAARHATAADLADMETQIALMERHMSGPPAQRIHHDHLFHYAMGRAARSPLLAQYQHEILEQLYARAQSYFDQYEDVAAVAALHRETLEAIASRSETRTREAIDRHLKPLEEAMERLDAGTASAAALPGPGR